MRAPVIDRSYQRTPCPTYVLLQRYRRTRKIDCSKLAPFEGPVKSPVRAYCKGTLCAQAQRAREQVSQDDDDDDEGI